MKQMSEWHIHSTTIPKPAKEGVEAVVLPVGDRDRIGCFADQVKLTHALVQDLDEAVKEL
jgi:hypothetical protein